MRNTGFAVPQRPTRRGAPTARGAATPEARHQVATRPAANRRAGTPKAGPLAPDTGYTRAPAAHILLALRTRSGALTRRGMAPRSHDLLPGSRCFAERSHVHTHFARGLDPGMENARTVLGPEHRTLGSRARPGASRPPAAGSVHPGCPAPSPQGSRSGTFESARSTRGKKTGRNALRCTPGRPSAQVVEPGRTPLMRRVNPSGSGYASK